MVRPFFLPSAAAAALLFLPVRLAAGTPPALNGDASSPGSARTQHAGADLDPSPPAALPAVEPGGDPLSVSIIIPTNGRPELCRHALEMIRRQTYGPILEVVVVDDSPLPLRMPRLESSGPYPWELVYEVMPTQVSVGAKRNRAVELCSGKRAC